MKKLSFFIALSLAAISLTACSNVGTDGDSNQTAGTEMTEIERIAATYEPVEDGRLIVSESNPNISYVYVDSSWREATDIEKKIGYACVRATRGSVVKRIAGVMPGNEYVCALLDSTKLYWKEASIRDYPKEMFFNPDVEYGSVIDNRDGRIYRTVDIAGMTWMAENLTYATIGADCRDSLSIGCVYSWNAAMNLAEGDTAESSAIHKGVCMDGWHIPDTTEWRTILDEAPIACFKSSMGWPLGSNTTGLSLVPIGYYVGAGIAYSYSSKAYADYITANYFLVSTSLIPMPDSSDKKIPHGSVMSFEVESERASCMLSPPRRLADNAVDRYLKAAIRCVKDAE